MYEREGRLMGEKSLFGIMTMPAMATKILKKLSV